MSRITGVGRRFLGNIHGAVTIDWVAVTAAFVVVGIGITYTIFGDEDGGLIAMVNSKQEQLADRANDVDDMLTEVEGWSPGGT
ncbi:MAG: hypothetical protein P8I56_00680 [Paracoccaceae bacterium]|jgi:hypothetical protein|nr:hypothetical protein [Paracoccaceae bacterium]MDG1369700.1 hypothetical protein [Paracoccaceae bacterium]MDG1969484.1 hypothetical protein [Paracoccaceae bacterium]